LEKYEKLVFSSCLRRLNDVGLAKDTTQAVFLVLSRKAKGISKKVPLSAWLLKTAKFAAIDLYRREKARKHYEGQAMNEIENHSYKMSSWHRLAPDIDDAILSLPRFEQDLVMSRYMEDLSVEKIAKLHSKSKGAIAMRISRALEKVRAYLKKHGASVTTSSLSLMMFDHLAISTPQSFAVDTMNVIFSKVKNSEQFSNVQEITKGIEKMINREQIQFYTGIAVICAISFLGVFGIANAQMRSEKELTREDNPVLLAKNNVDKIVPIKNKNKTKNPKVSFSSDSVWLEDMSFPSDKLAGVPSEMFSKDGSIIIPTFIKTGPIPFAATALFRDSMGKWKNLPLSVYPFAPIVWLNESNIIQGQPTKDRKGWNIVTIPLQGNKKPETKLLKKFSSDEISYIHHTHIVRTYKTSLVAIAGIYSHKKENYFLISKSEDNGETWSKPVKTLEGFSAHDDIPTVFKCVNNKLYFWGKRKHTPALVVSSLEDENMNWKEIELPDGKLALTNFYSDEYGSDIYILYGIFNTNKKIDIYFSILQDDYNWLNPVKIVGGLKPEDTLMQIKPMLVSNNDQILMAIADISGNWWKGEFKARLFGSNDNGKKWMEISTQSDWNKQPSHFLFGDVVDGQFIILTVNMNGRMRRTKNGPKPIVKLWNLIPGE
jgi:RNA polymerase sigma-70 factor, ECF subfamily